ncbi:hypothetical protein OQA88_2581 [Cercophora sp. LCS_1]
MEAPIHPRARISAIVRQAYRDEATRGGDNNTLWLSAWSKLQSTNTRFHLGALSADGLEWDLHDLWYLFFEASANISEDNPALDRLILEVIRVREHGPLVREDVNDNGLADAATSDGNAWTDLPFLIPDMTGYWLQNHAAMSSAQRLSFSKFLAGLASSGVGRDDGLCGIALAMFVQVLETPRALGTLADQQQEQDTSRQPQDLTIAAYLPSINIWFNWAGLRIVQLSESNKSWSLAEQAPGPLCRSSNIRMGLDMADGFCATRWIFWLTRLEDLVASFRGSGEDGLSTFAAGIMDNMLIIAEGTGGRLKKDLEMAYTRGTVNHRPVPQSPPSHQ